MIAGDLIGERARLTPGKTALIDLHTGRRHSYAELSERAIRCALVWTEACGLSKGSRIGLLAHNRIEFLDAFFAAGKSGVILVPLGTRLTAAELAEIIKDAELEALMYEGAFAETIDSLRTLVELEHWIALDEPVEARDRSYAGSCASVAVETWVNQSCDPEDVYCLLYTSGTTGKPKGVMSPHRQVIWNGYSTVACWQLREDDISPIFTPLYHAGGLGAFLVPIVVIGGTLVLHRGFDPAEIWHAIERERCTVVLGVPTIWRLLMEAPEFATVDLSSLRWLISGGAPLPTSIIEVYQARGVGFKQGFGMTEVGVNCFSMTLEQSRKKLGSIGKPMMYTRARVADESDQELPVGEVGELQFSGPHVCLGYWKQPDATAAAFSADGWFRTGDLARQDEDGFFTIAGRRKEMFISGGVNIYPAEIEAVLVRHPAVREAALIGVPHEKWGEVGIAFVVLTAPGAVSPEELLAHLGREIARFKIPREIRILEGLPRNDYGKVLKQELLDLYQGQEPRS